MIVVGAFAESDGVVNARVRESQHKSVKLHKGTKRQNLFTFRFSLFVYVMCLYVFFELILIRLGGALNRARSKNMKNGSFLSTSTWEEKRAFYTLSWNQPSIILIKFRRDKKKNVRIDYSTRSF